MRASLSLSSVVFAQCLACAISDVSFLEVGLTSESVQWTVCNANGTICTPATVPGQVQLDLLAAGHVQEPYFDFGPSALSWIPYEPHWTWTTQAFDLPQGFLDTDRAVSLVAEGIDTVADVFLNGVLVWHNDNQYRTARVNLTNPLTGQSVLQPTGNVLSVHIGSPVLNAEAQYMFCNRTAPGYCPTWTGKTIGWISILVNYLRKEPNSFGWDFAPAFAASGISKPIYLVSIGSVALRDVLYSCSPHSSGAVGPATGTHASHRGVGGIGVHAKGWALHPADGPSDWTCNATVLIDAVGGPASDGNLTLTIGGAILLSPYPSTMRTHARSKAGARQEDNTVVVPVQGLQPGLNRATFTFTAISVKAWWPNGLGSPWVHPSSLSFAPQEGEGTQAENITLSFPMTFRTVSLEQPGIPGAGPGDEGRLFFFTVNGQPFFSKGSNWVPSDAFEGRVTPLSLTRQLESMVAAGYNTLRVWGGGRYQQSMFYEAAAAYGLLIWQEFAFACAQYEVSLPFLSTVTAEVEDVVTRLQKYPILLWSGNNEVEWLGKYTPGSVESGYYGLLDWQTVLATAAAVEVDSRRPIVGSSPSNGNESAAWPVAWNANSEVRGDMHVYEYSCNCWDPDCYPRPRFASEFGWQSFPSALTMAQYLSSDQWYYWSPVMWDHDHHPSQPMDLILCKNVGDNWHIPGPQVNASYFGACANSTQAGISRRSNAKAPTTALTGRALSLAQQLLTSSVPSHSLSTPTHAPVSPTVAQSSNWTVYAHTLWMTQLAHAMCLKTEAEHYRHLQSDCDGSPGGQSTGCTHGSLYWMANEIWPAATKASLDYTGRWKVPHHFARQYFYAPLHVSARVSLYGAASNRSVQVWLALHPPAQPVTNGCIGVEVWDWTGAGQQPVGALRLPYNTSWTSSFAGGSLQVYNDTLASLLFAAGCTASQACDASSVFLLLTATDSACGTEGGQILHENFALLSPMKNVTSVANPGLAITDVEGPMPVPVPVPVPVPPLSSTGRARNGFVPIPTMEGRVFNVTIIAQHLPAAFVWLESQYVGWFSANAFLWAQEGPPPYTLTLTWTADAAMPNATRPLTPAQVAASLSIWSLWDVGGYD